MPDKKDKDQEEITKMHKDLGKALGGMKVAPSPPPAQGKTEFAKDKKFKDGQP